MSDQGFVDVVDVVVLLVSLSVDFSSFSLSMMTTGVLSLMLLGAVVYSV